MERILMQKWIKLDVIWWEMGNVKWSRTNHHDPDYLNPSLHPPPPFCWQLAPTGRRHSIISTPTKSGIIGSGVFARPEPFISRGFSNYLAGLLGRVCVCVCVCICADRWQPRYWGKLTPRGRIKGELNICVHRAVYFNLYKNKKKMKCYVFPQPQPPYLGVIRFLRPFRLH